MKITPRTLLIVIPALALYAALCWKMNFIQDDAYISYRYVANYLNGHGLVFNIGEHVEGFTNFGWVVLMILVGRLGADYIWFSKMLGFLFGAGVIVITFLIATRLLHGRSAAYAALATLLVGLNASLAYWAPAGLETAAFAFCSMLAVWLYLRGSWLLTGALLWAVLLRPEGAVVAALLIIAEWISERKVPRFSMACGIIAFILAVPFVVFKFAYYGSLFPNPFYAKTSASTTQLSNGLEYTWLFLRHYGFAGAGLAACLVLFKRLTAEQRAVLVFVLGFVLYVTLIGGDVLKVHRFFLPVFGLSALLAVLALAWVGRRLSAKTQWLIVVVAGAGLLVLTWYLPKSFVDTYNRQEKAFVRRMGTLARDIRKSDDRTFSVATPTIGVFSFELLGHKVIDMLGLADSTIARYSEDPIPGMVTTWKEAKHNTKYLLTEAPDYIVFSTGIKPSAPAERALLLYPEFQAAYRAVVWFYPDPVIPGRGVLNAAYKKMRDVGPVVSPLFPVEFAENYNRGVDAGGDGKDDEAISLLSAARKIALARGPLVMTEIQWCLGQAFMGRGEVEKGISLLDEALAIDSFTFGPHRELYTARLIMGDTARAAVHRKWLMKLVPWYMPRLDSLTEQRLKNAARLRQAAPR